MPSPEVIDLTLSDDEIQPDPIQSDQGPPTPNQATNRFRTSSSTSTGLGYLTSTLWRLASTHPLTMVLSQNSL